jgi:hypothetical protein
MDIMVGSSLGLKMEVILKDSIHWYKCYVRSRKRESGIHSRFTS